MSDLGWKLAALALVAGGWAGCGGSGTGDMASSDLAANNAAGDMTNGADMSNSDDLATPANVKHVTLLANGANPACYTLATATSTMDNPCPGDIAFLMGAKVDISAAGGANGSLCQLAGTYATVSAVPSDYSGCMWMPYVEGGVGLAGVSLIVRDRAGTHHYKWRIQSNDLPQIVFDQAPID